MAAQLPRCLCAAIVAAFLFPVAAPASAQLLSPNCQTVGEQNFADIRTILLGLKVGTLKPEEAAHPVATYRMLPITLQQIKEYGAVIVGATVTANLVQLNGIQRVCDVRANLTIRYVRAKPIPDVRPDTETTIRSEPVDELLATSVTYQLIFVSREKIQIIDNSVLSAIYTAIIDNNQALAQTEWTPADHAAFSRKKELVSRRKAEEREREFQASVDKSKAIEATREKQERVEWYRDQVRIALQDVREGRRAAAQAQQRADKFAQDFVRGGAPLTRGSARHRDIIVEDELEDARSGERSARLQRSTGSLRLRGGKSACASTRSQAPLKQARRRRRKSIEHG